VANAIEGVIATIDEIAPDELELGLLMGYSIGVPVKGASSSKMCS
jgi:hypothetical protein